MRKLECVVMYLGGLYQLYDDCNIRSWTLVLEVCSGPNPLQKPFFDGTAEAKRLFNVVCFGRRYVWDYAIDLIVQE